jgi:hypothetical protein
MKELSTDSRWTRVKFIWIGFIACALIAMLITSLFVYMSSTVYLVLMAVLYLALLGGGISAGAFRNGNDPAIRSHLSRHLYVLILFSFLYVALLIAAYPVLFTSYPHYGIDAGSIAFAFIGCIPWIILFSLSLFGVIRAHYQATLGSTRTLIFIILMIVCTLLAVLLFGLVMMSRDPVFALALPVFIGLIVALSLKKREELKRH